ncbi:E3 ubiquitin-protein ligase RNF217-like isoform X2 [Boleophthalmus pectinirostris]|nr:E3 ubiquitin-protein ligase RNF217-like isoform X2 [Boleophthalmus pectinirostris]
METEKCYNPNDPNLKFTDSVDEHDFLCMDYRSRRARMSCGHTVTPQSLTDWCDRQLQDGNIDLKCGVCGAVWPFDEVCKMALLTDKEKSTFEDKRLENLAFTKMNDKRCPGCKSYALRKNQNNLCVICPQCTAVKGTTYQFCWQCLKVWKGSAPRSDRCDNEGCVNTGLETLRTCPEIVFKSVEDVKGCPSVRACPTCGVLSQHNSEGCKNIVCNGCKMQFCFVCLKITKECLKTSSYSKPCSSGVAPRQTSIPTKN